MHQAVSSVIRAAAASEASGAAGALACARMCGPTARACDPRDVPVITIAVAVVTAVSIAVGLWLLAAVLAVVALLHNQTRKGWQKGNILSKGECGVDDAQAVAARQAMSWRLVLACEAWTNPRH